MGRKEANKGKDLAAAERRLKVLDLRKSGASYRSIVALLESQGVETSRSQVHRDVQQALKQLREKERLEVEELRELELERLDAMQLGIWQSVIGGKTSAVFAALAISKRRAEMCGLDAAIKHDVNINFSELSDEQLEAIVAAKS